MIIHRFKPVGTTNFGDALNDYLWPKLLPEAECSALDAGFYGIGTVLAATMPAYRKHVVLGAGIGYAGVPTLNSSWKVYFVRGPHTASALGGVPHITDPGILVNRFFKAQEEPTYPVSFMPRWDSLSPDAVEAVEAAGFHVIDPKLPVEEVMRDIAATGLLLSEALHGAVCADALRIPWVSIYANRGHEFKWRDWTASMDMVWNPIDAAEFTLSWARDNAVPQLSADSILDDRNIKIAAALDSFITDLKAGAL